MLNQPAWIRFIGDRGIRDLKGAEAYIQDGPRTSYQQHGFGLYLISLHDGTPLGLCGFLQRDYLDHPDIGFALHSDHWGQGYALEAAQAVMAQGRAQGITKVLAITTEDNQASGRLLRKLGLAEQGRVLPPGADAELKLFAN
ncbi:GNAT family N-acetyltransferase [Gallaecimonas kandeliae]|nr:GNAT family N-acetyltransferase [Gallaecimonas kandeliae]WKE67462.1 GNAT family N-acetyltransferase [Gallaecimonas kandeliae]